MEIMRLVVTGTVGAGKSTFIRSVSGSGVVDTDRQATDETAALLKQRPPLRLTLDGYNLVMIWRCTFTAHLVRLDLISCGIS